MFNSFIHLYHLSKELDNLLSGKRIRETYTYRKSHLVFNFEANIQLEFSCEGALPFLCLKTTGSKSRKSYPVILNLDNHLVESVNIAPADRFIRMQFSSGERALFKLFIPGANLFILDKTGEFRQSFKKTDIIPKIDFFSGEKAIYRIISDFEKNRFIDFAEENSNLTVKEILKLYFISFPKLLLKEVNYRIGTEKNPIWSNLNESDKDTLIFFLCEATEHLTKGKIYLYKIEKPYFSLLPLSFLPSSPEVFDDVNKATCSYIRSYHVTRGFSNRKQGLLQRLSSDIDFVKRTLKTQKQSLKRFPDYSIYKRYGDTLMLYLNEISKGKNSCELPSAEDPDELLRIPLKPGLSPVENAQFYYKLMKKYSSGKDELMQAITENESRLSQLSSDFERVAAIDTPEKLREWEKKIGKSAGKSGLRRSEQQSKQFMTIMFNNFEILIGRNSRENEELTLKFAKKEDFWFHTYEIPGSHVVVRNPGKLVSLPHDVLEKAAALAARYSQAKHSHTVPVIFTKVKYVSRIKNTPPGTVRYSHEKMIMIEPEPF